MQQNGSKKLLAVVGIGNSLAGDDGAGIEIIQRLRDRWTDEDRILFAALEGDLFAITELLPCAERFVFVDTTNQSDISAVMHTLERTGAEDPFPVWEVWRPSPGDGIDDAVDGLASRTGLLACPS